MLQSQVLYKEHVIGLLISSEQLKPHIDFEGSKTTGSLICLKTVRHCQVFSSSNEHEELTGLPVDPDGNKLQYLIDMSQCFMLSVGY